MESASPSTTMISATISFVGSCSGLDSTSTSTPTSVYFFGCDAYHFMSPKDLTESHASCFTTRSNGNSKSTHPTYFQCAVVINHESSTA
jgi:hypothetical protein